MKLYIKIHDEWHLVSYATSVPVAAILGSAFRAQGFETREED